MALMGLSLTGAALQEVMDAVASCWFEAWAEAAAEEVVLMRILQALLACLRAPLSPSSSLRFSSTLAASTATGGVDLNADGSAAARGPLSSKSELNRQHRALQTLLEPERQQQCRKLPRRVQGKVHGRVVVVELTEASVRSSPYGHWASASPGDSP
uniref:Uncharacterized protein n=1 Tax=Oryza nivara TaxID=4536 RepID=A0A0E0G8J0_ORYNI